MSIRQSQGLALFGVLSILILGNCSLGGSGVTSGAIAITTQIRSMPVNTTQTFYSSSGAQNTAINWSVLTSSLGSTGTPTSQSGTTSFTYTSPTTPPLYPVGSSYTPGTATITTYTGTTPTVGDEATETFTITAPSITVGFQSNPQTVATGDYAYIYAYAIGSTANGLTFSINGVPGGNATLGTIYPDTLPNATAVEYIYEAPPFIPSSGPTSLSRPHPPQTPPSPLPKPSLSIKKFSA